MYYNNFKHWNGQLVLQHLRNDQLVHLDKTKYTSL